MLERLATAQSRRRVRKKLQKTTPADFPGWCVDHRDMPISRYLFGVLLGGVCGAAGAMGCASLVRFWISGEKPKSLVGSTFTAGFLVESLVMRTCSWASSAFRALASSSHVTCCLGANSGTVAKVTVCPWLVLVLDPLALTNCKLSGSVTETL